MDSLFQNYNHLGFSNPYYFEKNNKLEINSNFQSILENRNAANIIDVPAVIENVVGRNILGDRTIIKDVNKTPWMAKPSSDSTKWEYFEVPNHYENLVDQNEMALEFLNLLKKEIYEYVKDKQHIGIMLTGGMDSRMIAGVLDLLVKEGTLENRKIISLTWGKVESRDVIYAKKIAKKMKWEWRHFPIESEDLAINIEASAIRGSEYSPIHLHAMMKVRDETDLDCILAGSFGDSIGRAEYAGKSVVQIKDLRDKINNVNGFLKKPLLNDYLAEIDGDINKYWRQFPQENAYQQLEQDYQIHYMRRKLNPCLSVVNEKIPLYQVFTNPSVFGYMWSMHPKLRNNQIYKTILSQFKTDLSDIPWARTGLIFDKTTGEADSNPKNYHSYSEHINNELFNDIKDLVLSNNLEKLNIFNMDSLEMYFKLMKSKLYSRGLKVEEKIIWLASLSRSIEMYNIQESLTTSNNNIFEKINSLSPVKENLLDQAKSIYINLRKK